MLRSVKRLYEPKHHYRRLDDVRTNLVNQLDCCSDKVGVAQSGQGLLVCYCSLLILSVGGIL